MTSGTQPSRALLIAAGTLTQLIGATCLVLALSSLPVAHDLQSGMSGVIASIVASLAAIICGTFVWRANLVTLALSAGLDVGFGIGLPRGGSAIGAMLRILPADEADTAETLIMVGAITMFVAAVLCVLAVPSALKLRRWARDEIAKSGSTAPGVGAPQSWPLGTDPVVSAIDEAAPTRERPRLSQPAPEQPSAGGTLRGFGATKLMPTQVIRVDAPARGKPIVIIGVAVTLIAIGIIVITAATGGSAEVAAAGNGSSSTADAAAGSPIGSSATAAGGSSAAAGGSSAAAGGSPATAAGGSSATAGGSSATAAGGSSATAAGSSAASAGSSAATVNDGAAPRAGESGDDFIVRFHAALAKATPADLGLLFEAKAFAFGVDAHDLAEGRDAIVVQLRDDLGVAPPKGFSISTKFSQVATDGDVGWLAEQLRVGSKSFVVTAVIGLRDGAWVIGALHWAQAMPNATAYRLAREGDLAIPDAIPDAHDDSPLANAMRTGFASKPSFVAARSTRAESFNFGSAGERLEGGETIKKIFDRIGATIRLHDAVKVGMLGEHGGWGVANVDFTDTDRDGTEVTQTFRVLAAWVKEEAGWRIVQTQWSNAR